ncbi:MAG TPA: hypothetical protein PLV92_14105, partial [Pirellulaceae bacterium]|nr:hypothetical protein [Pirellulaceae bacterium]
MTGDLEFGDDWGVVQRSSANGTTLDFSAVTGGLFFTIDGDSVTVGYLDSNRGASLTYDAAGQSYAILGSRASDKFLILDDSRTTSIDGRGGEDFVRFDSTVAATHAGATTTAIRADLSTFAVSNVENMTGQVSLGAGLRNEIVEAIGKWNTVATQFIAGESASARIPFLGLSLVEAFGRGFSATPPVDVAAAKSFAADL